MHEIVRNLAPPIGCLLIALYAWFDVRRMHRELRTSRDQTPEEELMPGKKRKSLRKGEIPKTRPDAERIDPAALHAWTMKRFPKIMARLREYELREEREKPPPETED